MTLDTSPGMEYLPGAWPGYVVDNQDPKQAGRIVACVPPYIEETAYWCQPMGWTGRNARQRGFGSIPEKGAPVVIFFLHGNPDHGAYYMLGPPGAENDITGVPTPLLTAASWEAREGTVVLQETANFCVYIEDHASSKILRLIDKRTGAHITIDSATGTSGKAGAIEIEGETQVIIKSEYGGVVISGSVITINGRRVLDSNDPI